MGKLSKLHGVVSLGLSQLRHNRHQTVFAIIGVTLAVLSVSLLGGVGYGVIETGQEKFEQSGRDIWIAGGSVQLQPGRIGGLEAPIHDAHEISRDIEDKEGVRTVNPMLFQTVYLGTNETPVEANLAVGVPDIGSGEGTVNLIEGEGFTRSGVAHYAGGNYTGPRVREVVLDPRLSSQYNVSVGDSLNVGGTVVDANQNDYELVGTSRTLSRFLGTPAVVVPLAELQSMTGKARTDSATMVTVSMQPGANTSALVSELEKSYPQYDIRTNREQLQAVLAKQALVIASGGVLVVAGFVAGLALTMNILSLLVYQQRRTLAAVQAIGMSKGSLFGSVTVQGLVIGIVGGGLGLGLTPVFATGLSRLAFELVGFEGLVQTPAIIYQLGAVVAVGVGTVSAFVASWRVAKIDVLEALRR